MINFSSGGFGANREVSRAQRKDSLGEVISGPSQGPHRKRRQLAVPSGNGGGHSPNGGRYSQVSPDLNQFSLKRKSRGGDFDGIPPLHPPNSNPNPNSNYNPNPNPNSNYSNSNSNRNDDDYNDDDNDPDEVDEIQLEADEDEVVFSGEVHPPGEGGFGQQLYTAEEDDEDLDYDTLLNNVDDTAHFGVADSQAPPSNFFPGGGDPREENLGSVLSSQQGASQVKELIEKHDASLKTHLDAVASKLKESLDQNKLLLKSMKAWKKKYNELQTELEAEKKARDSNNVYRLGGTKKSGGLDEDKAAQDRRKAERLKNKALIELDEELGLEDDLELNTKKLLCT